MSDSQPPAPSSESARTPEPLVIRSLEFIGGMASFAGWRPEAGLPEVAFAGRSNVGKSSLLNRLIHRKKFARVSNTPGRTREINFFKVNDNFILVDLPGYGYARISKERRAEWRPLIEKYLRYSVKLRGIVHLLDVRHDPTNDDRQMLDFLGELGVPTVIVLTKIDKLTPTQRRKRIAEISRELGLDEDQTVPFSATTGEGRDDLAAAIESLLAQPAWRDEGDTAEPPASDEGDVESDGEDDENEPADENEPDDEKDETDA